MTFVIPCTQNIVNRSSQGAIWEGTALSQYKPSDHYGG